MMRRLLVVSPQFHGYHESVARAFRQLGYDTSTFCYDTAQSSGERVWNKVGHELPAKVTGVGSHLSAERASRRAVEHLREAAPDVVLVVRGDVLTEEFWHEASSAGRPVAVWMYDELRRTSFDPSLVSRYAALATYSAGDADLIRSRGYQAAYIPLGFDDLSPSADGWEGTGVISFIGAPLSARTSALTALVAAGLPVRAWGRGWSGHPLDRARTWRLRGSGVPNARDIPADRAHAIMRNSLATLNIHGDQEGFTMRTFEACGTGGVQLVDRHEVCEFYEPSSEVLTFDGHDELLDLARRVVARPQDYSGLRVRAREATMAKHTLVHRAVALEQLWI